MVVWRPVPGYEGAYSVSDEGEVRSEPRRVFKRGKSGGGWRDMPGITIRGSINPHGYRQVGLWLHNKGLTFPVHRLVLLAFRGPLPHGGHSRHLDGDKLNNRLVNLAYGTPQENSADSLLHGALPLGSQRAWSKLTEADVEQILRAPERTGTDLARAYGVGRKTIERIRRGLRWKHVPRPQGAVPLP